MLKEITMQVQRINVNEDKKKMEGREDASFLTSFATMRGSFLIEGIHLGMMTITSTIPSGVTTIKRMVGSTKKEKEMLPLLNMEIFNLPKDQETLDMMNLML